MTETVRGKWPVWVIPLVALILAIGLTIRSVETTFNVTASTELVKITADSFAMPRWELDGATIVRGLESRSTAVSGSVEFVPAAEIRVQRVSGGPLRIIATAPEGFTSVGVLFDEDGIPVGEFDRRLLLSIPDVAGRARQGLSLVLPFSGRVELGSGSAAETGRAIVRSGSIAMLGRTVVGGNRFEARSATLDAGDQFMVQRPVGPAVGFVRADERSGLTVVYRVLGRKGVVTRYGSQGYTVSASLRDRLLKDHVLQGIWLTTVAIIGFATKLAKQPKQQ